MNLVGILEFQCIIIKIVLQVLYAIRGGSSKLSEQHPLSSYRSAVHRLQAESRTRDLDPGAHFTAIQ